MKTKLGLIAWALLSVMSISRADNVSVLPYPNAVRVQSGSYLFERFDLSVPDSLKSDAVYLKALLKEEFGMTRVAERANGNLQFVVSPLVKNSEAYQLKVDKEGVKIIASSSKGFFYGLQTLRQLFQKCGDGLRLNYVEIDDCPAFKVRSFMLDDGRAFKGVQEVKRLLEEMSILKMNVFQWHLTEDQGWRIEIKKYPKLAQVGGRRDSTQLDWYESKRFDGVPYEGYYTQEEIKDIVKYATERHITIIPEIEMPGHASAAIAAYPWLGTSGKEMAVPCAFGVQTDVFNVASPKVLTFLTDVLDEVMALFPSKVIHIGGDEVKYDQWNASEEVQAFMKQKKIHTTAELQIWFTNYISKYLHAKGRRMMGWNDVTGDKIHGFQSEMKVRPDFKLASDAVVQFWTGDISLLTKAAEKGYEIVNSLHEYTDLNYNHDKIPAGYEYSFAPISLEKAYAFNPVPKDFPAAYKSKIIGMGCQMWGEWIPTVKQMNKMIYPYWAAHAETGWTEVGNKDFTRFKSALPYFIKRWFDKGYLYF